MRDRVLTIVNLIAQYVFEKRDLLGDGNIIQELLDIGFDLEEINAAFHWIENISIKDGEKGESCGGTGEGATRVFTVKEKQALSLEAQGLLLKMQAMGMVSAEEMEDIISQATSLEEDGLSCQELKAVLALVLFSRSLERYGREIECILRDEWSLLYH